MKIWDPEKDSDGEKETLGGRKKKLISATVSTDPLAVD